MNSGSLRRLDAEAAWPDAAPLLAAALAGSDDTLDELRERCRGGAALLLGGARGFVVIEPVASPRGCDLLVWAAASGGAMDCIRAHEEELERIGRGMGASTLIFRTNRRGFERVLSPAWSIRQYTWAKEL